MPHVYIKAYITWLYGSFHTNRIGGRYLHDDLVFTSSCQSDQDKRYEESLVTDVYHFHDWCTFMVDLWSARERYTCDSCEYDNIRIFIYHTRVDNLL